MTRRVARSDDDTGRAASRSGTSRGTRARAEGLAAAAFATSVLALLACGSADTSGLYSPSGSAPALSTSHPQSGAGGFFAGSGGTMGSGGTSTTGSFAGSSGSGGTTTIGGSGGSASGGSSATGGTTSTTGTTGPFDPTKCDYSGTWGTYASVPVGWAQTIAIIAGTGTLRQWTLSQEVQAGPGTVSSSTIACGISIPDFKTNIFGGSSAFGIRFPPSVFDGSSNPPANFVITAAPAPSGGFQFSTSAFAFQIGFRLASPETAAWPGTAGLSTVDDDHDQHPGVTIVPATGAGYSFPPTSVPFPGTPVADLLYLAQRTVSSLSGLLTSCDELDGSVKIETVAGTPAIDSSIIGCHVSGGSDCTASQSGFIDQNRPIFTPTGQGTMISKRLPPGATCADVRAAFPQN